MQLQAGMRLRSVACDTQVIAVRVPADDVDLRCGGHPMVPLEPGGAAAPGDAPAPRDAAAPGDAAAPTEPLAGAWADGTLLGKRYGSEELGLEVLCTKAGAGSLAIGDQALPLKTAKPLPASD